MGKVSNAGKIVIIAVAAVVLIILVIVYGTGGLNNNLASNTNSSGTNDSGNSAVTATSLTQTPSLSASGAGKSNGTPTTRSPAPPVIHFITPVKNDIWKITTQDVISWSLAGGITGSISLIDATTKQFIGTILPQVGPSQTSYTWNTRDLLLDRTSPFKKDVLPGTYEIQIMYDGNHVQPATSPAFTITN